MDPCHSLIVAPCPQALNEDARVLGLGRHAPISFARALVLIITALGIFFAHFTARGASHGRRSHLQHAAYATVRINGQQFFFVDSLRSALGVLPVLWRDRGMLGAAKLLAKVSLHRCVYFGLVHEHEALSTGVLALGYCRFYPVPSDSIVIGEVVTAPRSRGKGHATRAIMLAISTMIRKGSTNFYIDTQRHNIPMIKSIAKLGFGRPIAGDAAAEYS